MEIPIEKRPEDSHRYIPTGNIISRQAIGIAVVPAVIEYHAAEFYDKKKGRNTHSAFPAGVTDDVNNDESMKAFLFLLNSRCNVSLEKTAQFVSDITGGALASGYRALFPHPMKSNNCYKYVHGQLTYSAKKCYHGCGKGAAFDMKIFKFYGMFQERGMCE